MSYPQSIETYSGCISADLKELHPVLQRVYAARHITHIDELDYTLNRLLHFKNLKNISDAAELLANAICTQKRILIVGDFDTDGATSTVVALLALRQFGGHCIDYLVPNRFEYGYGLTPEILAIADKPDLIMTVDNGISSTQGVLAAKKQGIQVLITDHHLPPESLPCADVIVNPQQPGDKFESKNLAGVGVTFYVMLALRDKLHQKNWFQSQGIAYPAMHHLLDLVALGTVADMVPLDLNNRILVMQGLYRIRSLKVRPGIKALSKLAGVNVAHCTARTLGFSIAPKLNAAGRLEDMSLGIECLLSDSQEEALALATQLDELNKKRRAIETTMQKEAFESLSKIRLPTAAASICLFDSNWHQGVTGLVAGRIKDRFQKPTIVFAPSQERGELKGSARSIPGIHVRDVLADIATQYPHILSRFGGHAAAAGLSLSKEYYSQFATIFEKLIQELISNNFKSSTQKTDGALSEKELNLTLALLIQKGGPWGQGFPEPLFDGQFQVISQRLVGLRHLQMTLKHAQLAKPLKAILFNANLDEWPNSRAQWVRVLYQLTVNEWEGRRDVQLQIEKIYEVTA